MSLWGKISGAERRAAQAAAEAAERAAAEAAERLRRQPQFRFGGFQTMGACQRPEDTRTTEKLLANIDYFAENVPEVAQFRDELKSMNPKHLGVTSDILELGTTSEMLPDAIHLRKLPDGTNILRTIVEKLPKASRENPAAMELFQEVINQTDSRAAKVFLIRANGVLEHPELAKQMTATKPLVKDIAEAELKGGYTMDYDKENNFTTALGYYLNPKSDAKKIELLPEVLEVADKLPVERAVISGPDFVWSDAPVARIKENLEVLPQVAENLAKQTKEMDIGKFLTRNVNLD